MARWLEILAEYNMEIMDRPGKQHCNADALSRSRQCAKAVQETPTPTNVVSFAPVQSINNGLDIAQLQCNNAWLYSENIKQQQRSDEDLKLSGWKVVKFHKKYPNWAAATCRPFGIREEI